MPTIRERLSGVGKKPVREIIGRAVAALPGVARWKRRALYSVDATETNYEFWDKFRRGKQAGFEYSGLLGQAIAAIIASWVFGGGVQAELAESAPNPEDENHPINYTNMLLQRFMTRLRGTLLQFGEDLYGLGNQYIFINPDGSLSIPSPDLVAPRYADLDYRELLALTINSVAGKAEITDEYREDGRTVTIKNTSTEALTVGNVIIPPAQTAVFQYANLIGRLPAVHFANERSANEVFGRPLAEPLYPIFDRYNNLVETGAEGAEILSNPVPVFEGMENVQETIELNGEQTTDEYVDSNGVTQNRWRLVFDRLKAVVVGKGGSFKFVAPQKGFTEDVRSMLKLLFLLVLDFTRIPEVVWGNELSSSRASAQEQMRTFYAHIEARRLALEGEGMDEVLGAQARNGLLALIDVWLRTMALTDRRIVVGTVNLRWPELATADYQVIREWVQMLLDKGIITDELAVRLANVTEDAAKEVQDAKAQRDAERDQFEQAVDDLLNTRESDDDEETLPEEDLADAA